MYRYMFFFLNSVLQDVYTKKGNVNFWTWRIAALIQLATVPMVKVDDNPMREYRPVEVGLHQSADVPTLIDR